MRLLQVLVMVFQQQQQAVFIISENLPELKPHFNHPFTFMLPKYTHKHLVCFNDSRLSPSLIGSLKDATRGAFAFLSSTWQTHSVQHVAWGSVESHQEAKRSAVLYSRSPVQTKAAERNGLGDLWVGTWQWDKAKHWKAGRQTCSILNRPEIFSGVGLWDIMCPCVQAKSDQQIKLNCFYSYFKISWKHDLIYIYIYIHNVSMTGSW